MIKGRRYWIKSIYAFWLWRHAWRKRWRDNFAVIIYGPDMRLSRMWWLETFILCRDSVCCWKAAFDHRINMISQRGETTLMYTVCFRNKPPLYAYKTKRSIIWRLHPGLSIIVHFLNSYPAFLIFPILFPIPLCVVSPCKNSSCSCHPYSLNLAFPIEIMAPTNGLFAIGLCGL